MHKRSLFLVVVSFLILLSFFGGVLFWFHFKESQTKVVFLNIGQGDAILISQGRNQILIDGGKSGKALLGRLGRHIPFWDRSLEVIIATHPDSDHIGGLPAVLGAYHVDTVLSTGATSKTETSRIFEEAAQSAEEGKHKVFSGTKITLPQGGELLVEYPMRPLEGEVKETNATSIVSRFQYKSTSFLLTGDLASEERALPSEQSATILKAAHHGSKYSTSEAFLNLVQPREAVISVGKNSYGHPAPEVLERLEKQGVSVRRTDREGDIRYTCSEALQGCISK